MHESLRAAAEKYGDRDAVWFGDATWSWRRLDDAAGRVAASLADRVRPHDRVAVMASNRPEFIVVVNAISRLGAATVLLSPAWKQREVSHALTLTGAGLGFADGSSLDLLRDVLGPDHVISLDEAIPSGVTPRRESEGGVTPLGAGEGGVTPLGGISLDDESVLVFSSGTTGLPKAVRHTHRSMGHAVVHWVQTLGLTDDDRFQIATPPSHILGLLNLLTAAAAGATVRLHPRFDLDEVLRRIESDRMTLEMAVAPIALAMANHPSIEDYDLSSLRYIMWGATPVTPSVAELVTKRTGVRWLPAYGASELPVITVNPVDQPDRWRLDSAGLPPDGVELRVVDLDTREVLPFGETGEVQVCSESVMVGYLPAEDNADAFDDGWYRTGDVGWLEAEGWVHLTDRSKEMVKVKGFQVAPAEIEAVLHGHSGVRDCAVFGIPDLEAGERPVAAVTLVDGDGVTPDELKQLVAESLATYKQLAAVVVVDEIPRLPSGKVLRRTLSAEWTPKLVDRT
jgi:acyl-CoA synthetase (AMP-forming)/AMP-acid ligase II